MTKFVSILIVFFSFQLQAAIYPVSLGDTTVKINVYEHGFGKAFVHLHQNETTALRAAKTVIKKNGGRLLTLQHKGTRNIVFHLRQKRYEFDPNRIYTDVGIKKTLSQFGKYSLDAHKEVKKLANKITSLIPNGKIIAVHNNRGYSLKDYLPGHRQAHDARALNFYDKKHFRNFYLVTKESDFKSLKALNFNGILQKQNANDDGSLSIYLADNDYINVEAGFNELKAQINMLEQA